MAWKTTVRAAITTLTMVAALALTAVPAFAAGPGGAPGAGGGRGGGNETTLGNNLSVPAYFVPNTSGAPALRVACANSPQAPQGPQSTIYTGYWLQKTEATWSAYCADKMTDNVTAQWGANLTDAPSIAAGKPVRVEVSLLDPAAPGLLGYTVIKLNDDPDRVAPYGTNGTTFNTVADPNAGQVTRVWTPGATLKIEQLVNGSYTTIYDQPITAEINSTGAVVYGYNWGSMGKAPSAGAYRLTFSVPTATSESGVTITGVATSDSTQRTPKYTASSTWLDITLTSTHGGGRGGR